MTYAIQLFHEDNIVNVCHTGVIDKIEMNTGKNDSFFQLTYHSWNKILLDLTDAEFQLLATDVALTFKDLNHKHPTGVFLAVVKPAKIDFDYCQYAKTIAIAWSNFQIEVFTDKGSALEWLRKQ